MADAAAGDARIAIGILRTAARYADRDAEGKITREVITEAIPEAKSEIHQKSLDKLNPHRGCHRTVVMDAARERLSS